MQPLTHQEQQQASEIRFDYETVQKAAALAVRIQEQRRDLLTLEEIDVLGAEVGIDPSCMREALNTLAAAPAGRSHSRPARPTALVLFSLGAFALLLILFGSWIYTARAAVPPVASPAAVPAATARAAVTPRWTTLVSDEGRFSVRMPAPVEDTLASSEERGGTVHQYLYQASLGSGRDFVVSCWDYTSVPERRLDASELDAAVRAQRDSLRPGQTSVKTLRLGSVPGRELQIVHADGGINLFRLYVSGRRLYSISAAANGRPNMPDESQTFLDSFRLF
jgi:hypothetical protein